MVSTIISVTELVDESLSGPTLAAVGEGLTEEELELAKQILEVTCNLLNLFLCPQRNFRRHIVDAPYVRPALCPVHISYIL